MAKFLILVAVCAICVTATLSLPPAINEDAGVKVVDQGHQALIAMSDDGNPELVIVGGNIGRADLSKITNLFNFTAYLQGRPENATAISFVPLITILSSLTG